MMDKPLSNDSTDHGEFLQNQPTAKITMNIPHFQLTTPPKIMPTSSIRGGYPMDFNPRTIPLNVGSQMPRGLASHPFGTFEKQSTMPPVSLPVRPTSVPMQMQLDPGVLASFRTSPSVIDRPPPGVVDPSAGSAMINRVIHQPQHASYNVPIHQNQFPNFAVTSSSQRIETLPETRKVFSPIAMAQILPTPLTRPSVTLTVSKPPVNHPNLHQQQFMELDQLSSSKNFALDFMDPSHSTIPVPSSPMMVMINEGVSITSMPASNFTNINNLANLTPQSTQLGNVKMSLSPNSNNSMNMTNPVEVQNTSIGHKSPTTPSLSLRPTPTNPDHITPIPINPPPNNFETNKAVSADKEPSPDKTVGKLRGPKCYRQPEHRSGTEVSLGPYQRPAKVPVKLKCSDIRREDIAMLVMPSEDWSCSVYPAPTNNTCRQGRPIYVISETLLNFDLVEIVRKSISIQPNWGMKFSVMSVNATKFNLGLDASDITDIQAILDNFDSFPVCSGIRDDVSSKPLEASEITKATSYCDGIMRSNECPLLLVNLSDKKCSSCLKLLNANKN